ncbi:MAG: hypothetical protein LBH16_08675, partial [Treponema sp.]|nr:hypothetical protein [Treponema sp.]
MNSKKRGGMPESLLSEDEMINILAETGFFANKDTSHVKEVTIEYSSNGKGKYTWPDNGEYEGDFFEGEFHGKGKRIFPNGDIYEG